MLNLDSNYPGMRLYIAKGGFSVQAQSSHNVRTATDQRGEQSINRDAKTSGLWLSPFNVLDCIGILIL